MPGRLLEEPAAAVDGLVAPVWRILATETDLSSHPANFDRYLRLELSEPDAFAQGWPEP